MKNKKIVILGGGENQLPLLIESKKLGYYIILCDFRSQNPGKHIADIHYLVNTLNYEEVLNVCIKEQPDGIITNSEPAIPIMTKVANKLGLIGNSESGIAAIMSKDKFRALQSKLGHYCPKHILVSSVEDLKEKISDFQYPIIIKPCECSGSRGAKRIDSYNKEEIECAFTECLNFSRNGMVEIEEFVLMPSLTTIEGDVFVHNGTFLWEGIFSTTRASYAPMVPMTYSIPIYLDDMRMDIVKTTILSIFNKVGIVHGEFNIEGYFNKHGDFFLIEINARQGGHEIPQFIEAATSINMTKLLVSTAVGDDSYWNSIFNKKTIIKSRIKHVVYSESDGYYNGIKIDRKIKDYIQSIKEFKNIGDNVIKCTNGTSLIAIIDLAFDDNKSLLQIYDKMENLIKVQVSQSDV